MAGIALTLASFVVKKVLVPPKWIIQYDPWHMSHVKAADDITEKTIPPSCTGSGTDNCIFPTLPTLYNVEAANSSDIAL